jgi:hypothetical protein
MYGLQIVVCPFVLFLLIIVLSVLLRYMDSDYPFGIFKLFLLLIAMHHIGGVMVSVLAFSAVDRGFEPRSDQAKDYKIGIYCYSAKHSCWTILNTNIPVFIKAVQISVYMLK